MNFDVVIVNYYSGERLNALLSLARDFFGDATIYIVNNSPDEAVASHVTAAADVVYIRNDRNVGFAAAVNQAVRRELAEAIVLINPDITGISGDAQLIAQAFASDERLAAVAVKL